MHMQQLMTLLQRLYTLLCYICHVRSAGKSTFTMSGRPANGIYHGRSAGKWPKPGLLCISLQKELSRQQ